jgi:hypothetical protein
LDFQLNLRILWAAVVPAVYGVFYQNVGEEESYLFTQKGEMQPDISKYFVIYWRVFEKLKLVTRSVCRAPVSLLQATFFWFIESVHVGWYSLATASWLPNRILYHSSGYCKSLTYQSFPSWQYLHSSWSWVLTIKWAIPMLSGSLKAKVVFFIQNLPSGTQLFVFFQPAECHCCYI